VKAYAIKVDSDSYLSCPYEFDNLYPIGEKALLAAILYRALADLTLDDKKLSWEAWKWFKLGGRGRYGSFLYICDHLELEPAQFRKFAHNFNFVKKCGWPRLRPQL
jgi:hypothetical protein